MYSSGGNGMAISMNMMQARNDRRGKRAELPDDIARKLKSCSVLNCEDWRDLGSYTTYHCFPTGDKNQDRWEIWTQLLRKSREDESWIPFRGSLVCSHHFRPEDFVNEPMSKRRKLIKNAIPSIFPTFTVDLEDPSFQLPDDGTEADANGSSEQEEYYYAGSMLDLTGEEGYEYEYSTEADETDVQGASEMAHLGHDDDDDIQVLHDIKELPKSSSGLHRNLSSGTSNANSTIITSMGQVQVLSTPSVLLQQQKQKTQRMQQLVQIPPNQVIHLNGNKTKAAVQVSASARPQQQQRIMTSSQSQSFNQKPPPKKLSRQQEAVAAMNALPFSLNPDLEIEMVDPEEDLAACRNRISELEQENRSLTTLYENALETLKQKYETRLQVLRNRLKEQDRVLKMHQLAINNNVSPPKKIRLS